MKFRKKPVVIEAVKVVDIFSKPQHERPEWVNQAVENGTIKVGPNFLKINTLEGATLADLTGWLVQGVNGKLYPCKPDIFDKTYEPVQTAHTVQIIPPPTEPPPTEPRGYVHAQVLADYAEDAQVDPEPWLNWECGTSQCEWLACTSTFPPGMLYDWHYRRKRKPQTRKVEAYETPMPMTEAPPVGTYYWVGLFPSGTVAKYTWSDDKADALFLHMRKAYHTKAGAEAALEAEAEAKAKWLTRIDRINPETGEVTSQYKTWYTAAAVNGTCSI